MDFTVKKYSQLLVALKNSGMQFNIRHDVDLKPENSLRIAKIEAELGVRTTYYFRMVPESYNEDIILEISSLGHEIGYHYETLTTCNGDIDSAYVLFCQHLESLRKIVPVTSICMHGSPRSKWDSKDIWKKYDYRELGIKYEPYLDTDFSNALYLTDTGRRWDGYRVSVRDKIPGYQEVWESEGLSFHSSNEIIAQLNDSHSVLRQSGKILYITTHPQRWTPIGKDYFVEYGMQFAKNIVKWILVRKKH